jgi:hypothetical protein
LTHNRNGDPMRRIAIGLLYALGGYLAGAFIGYFLVLQLSANTHDRSVEAAMTSVFFFGPLSAAIAFVIGAVRAGRTPPPQ